MDFLKVGFWILIGTSWCLAKLVHFHQTYPKGNGHQVAYEFGYAIDDPVSGVVTDRWEEKRAGVVKGAYSLLEPGGGIRSVDYQVHPGGGFRAVVRNTRPGYYFLSSQEFKKSSELHREPSLGEVELQRRPPPLILTLPDRDPPINYHAITAEILGFQKLFGGRLPPRELKSLVRGERRAPRHISTASS